MTPWTAAHHASLSFTISWSLLKLMSIRSMMPSNHFILCHPLLLKIFIALQITVGLLDIGLQYFFIYIRRKVGVGGHAEVEAQWLAKFRSKEQNLLLDVLCLGPGERVQAPQEGNDKALPQKPQVHWLGEGAKGSRTQAMHRLFKKKSKTFFIGQKKNKKPSKMSSILSPLLLYSEL